MNLFHKTVNLDSPMLNSKKHTATNDLVLIGSQRWHDRIKLFGNSTERAAEQHTLSRQHVSLILNQHARDRTCRVKMDFERIRTAST